MLVTANKEKSTDIDDEVIKQILNIYPEEKLFERPIFQEAFGSGSIEFKTLRDESDKILIPWQMFLLEQKGLKKELDHIEKIRSDKISAKLVSKRAGIGKTTSKRILDRLIRLQNFICENNEIPVNQFCGALVGKSDNDAINHIESYFDIDLNKFRSYSSKSDALKYLISKIEAKNINISQGVLTNKMLPHHLVVDGNLYKNTSGFVIKDDCIPFMFLPSEINPDETDGRQIYTLIYLLVLIGLSQYDLFLERDFKVTAVGAKGKLAKIHKIASGLLLPVSETEKLRNTPITFDIRDKLASDYKITPTAVVVTLRIRNIIKTTEDYKALLPGEYKKNTNAQNHSRTPGIETSVRKFCGKYSFDLINAGIKNGSVPNIQAQYLLLGSVNKKNFKKYRSRLKI